jgi:hypothetical protein
MASHTHGCPDCGTVTVHACYGRNINAADGGPAMCEYEGDEDFRCDDCYDADMAEADRVEREAFAARMRLVREAQREKAAS